MKRSDVVAAAWTLLAKLDPSWKQIHRASDKDRPGWVRDFFAAAGAVRDGIDAAAMKSALAEKSVADSLKAIDWGVFTDHLTQQLGKRRLALAAVGAKIAADSLKLELNIEKADNVKLAFNLTNGKSFDVIEAQTADLVREVGDETKAAIKALLERSFRVGIPPAKLGRQIREHIGLTMKQSIAVANYQAFLERLAAREDLNNLGEESQERLARGLRNPRSVAPILRSGLSEDKIESMTDSYRDRLLNERADNIARTETLRAANEGQRLLWQDAVAQGQLDSQRMIREWVLTPDDRLCELCAKMIGDRAVTEIDGTFNFPETGEIDGPPGHPRCRCTHVLRRREKDEAA